MTVSVLVLTLNEEANIAACLQSVAWSDDVVVLDSGSADRTTELAAAAGARVVVRPFDDYAGQRNFGLREIAYRHPWVLMLDADECVSADLGAEIAAAVATAPAAVCLYRMRRKDFLFGTWIRGSGGYPTWFSRLARVGRVWVERPVNEEYCTDGAVGRLEGHLQHYPFNKGFAAWIDKHNRYSSMEAALLEAGAEARAGRARLGRVFSTDPVERRRALKRILYALPLRPLMVFLGVYLLRLGILEGRAGFTFAVLRSWYEFAIDCKRREARRRRCGEPV